MSAFGPRPGECGASSRPASSLHLVFTAQHRVMSDDGRPVIDRAFFPELMKKGTIEPRDVAYALNGAAQKRRKSEVR
jgi:hypothetical protein